MDLRLALLGASLSVATSMCPLLADACGGCVYAPPPVDAGPRRDTPFVVTDHRMVLSIGPRATVLWDQVRYAGRPEDFAWILPVRGEVQVAPGSAAFIDEIDEMTRPAVASPSFRCDPTTGTVTITQGTPSAMAGPFSDELRSVGVEVVHQEVAGPYEVTTLRGDDPMMVHEWLTGHGYRVGDDVAPELAWYAALRMDFVVARLRPGEGVQAIQPLRVRLPAGSSTLPLRMIRAGAIDRTGLTLFVVAAARQEVSNFSAATIPSDDLTWDFATGTSDYNAAFTRALARAGDRAWVTELSGAVPAASPFTAAAANDWAIASEGITRPWVTRLRTSLSRGAMGTDLQIGASDGPAVANEIPAGRWRGEPAIPCPAGPRDAGFVRGDAATRVLPPRWETDGCGCRVGASGGRPTAWGWMALALAVGARRLQRGGRGLLRRLAGQGV